VRGIPEPRRETEMDRPDIERLLGRLAMKFSAMDFVATEIMHHLIAGSNVGVGVELTNPMLLGKKLDLVKKLLPNRLRDSPGVETKVLNWVTRTECFSKHRNRFIHGMWGYDKETFGRDGEVTVLDLRTKYRTKGGKHKWRRGKAYHYGVKDLGQLDMAVGLHVLYGTTLLNELQLVTTAGGVANSTGRPARSARGNKSSTT
jgi:hypothetical protein